MIDLTEQLLSLPIGALKREVRNLCREDTMAIMREFKDRSRTLRLQMDAMEPGTLYDERFRAHGILIAKIAVCEDHLGKLKAELVTLATFFGPDENGEARYYQRASKMADGPWMESLLDRYGADAPCMIKSVKINPAKVPPELWDDTGPVHNGMDDIPRDTEAQHEHFSM